MFEAKTVFILGAGASWHYGYPTGEELVQHVIQKANTASNYFRAVVSQPAGQGIPFRPSFVARALPEVPADGLKGMLKQWNDAISECQDLAERIRSVDPLVIDYFLGNNPQLEEVGKLCITWAILEREAVYAEKSGNENRRALNRYNGKPISPLGLDNWYRFIVHKLMNGCIDGPSLLKNNVAFITFNYDVSLENEIRKALKALLKFEAVVDDFLSEDRVLHVYGKVRQNAFDPLPKANWRTFGPISAADNAITQPGPSQLWTDAKVLLDAVYEASAGIEIIAPDKAAVTPTIQVARKMIREAECVYILGYGFDPINNKLLDLQRNLYIRDTWKRVLFTNFGNRGVINKTVSSMLFSGNANVLLEERGQIEERFLPFACEKSIRTVYEALAYDFDNPEERPHS